MLLMTENKNLYDVIFTCEDIMLFSRVKICLRAKLTWYFTGVYIIKFYTFPLKVFLRKLGGEG